MMGRGGSLVRTARVSGKVSLISGEEPQGRRSTVSVLKNSVGVWAFGPAVTRFVPPGYHREVADGGMV